MSQAGILDVEKSNPQIATSYTTDSGTAIPIANNLEILGTGGIITSASGKTVTIDGSSIVSSVYIDGDSGTIAGTVLTIYADNVNNNCGSSVKFVNTNPISTLNVTDSLANTLIGSLCGNLTISGINNTALGRSCLSALTSGQYNVALGFASGVYITTGSQNVLIGHSTGLSYTSSEFGNILLGSDVRGVLGESFVSRIGNAGNGGSTPQSACYIDGITVVSTVSNQKTVVIDSTTGQLGSLSGSPSIIIKSGNIDLLATGDTTLFTTTAPFVLVDIIPYGVSLTGVIGAPLANFGWTGASYDDIANGFGNFATTQGNVAPNNFGLFNPQYPVIPTATAFKINVTSADATATINTQRIDVMGYYL